jgi:hypothetical protein
VLIREDLNVPGKGWVGGGRAGAPGRWRPGPIRLVAK